MKFLLPVDGSTSCRRAENYIVELLDPENDAIDVLCVVEAVPISQIDEDESDATSIRSRINEEAEIVVDDTVDRLKENDFEVTSHLDNGNAGETIVEYSQTLDVDGIVLGRQGKGQVEEFLLGSVSNYVLRHAQVPVVTVPKDWEKDFGLH